MISPALLKIKNYLKDDLELGQTIVNDLPTFDSVAELVSNIEIQKTADINELN